MTTYKNHIIKRLILTILILFILFIGIQFLFKLSKIERKAKENVANSLKIEIGMPKQEAINIMGEPDNKRISFHNEVDSLYYYEPPFGASSGIYIQFDSKTNKVNHIDLYD